MKKCVFITLLIFISSGFNELQNEIYKPIITKVPDIAIFDTLQAYKQAIENMKSYEVYKAEPYSLFGDDYIGYGHLLMDTTLKNITEKQADSLLRCDYNSNVSIVRKMLVTYKDERFVFLAGMLSFNVGCGRVSKSRFFESVKNESPDSVVISEYLGFCNVNGKMHPKLLERRKDELKIWLNFSENN